MKILFFLIFTLSLFAQEGRAPKAPRPSSSQGYEYIVIEGDTLFGIIFKSEARSEELELLGIRGLNSTKSYKRGWVSKNNLRNISESKSISWYHRTRWMGLDADTTKKHPDNQPPEGINMDKVSEYVCAPCARAASKTDGEGVVIGIIDTGIDITHPAFKDADGNSRIYKIWDQDAEPSAVGVVCPWVFYGTTYDQDDINDGYLEAGEIDENGHGTIVAGIAAGSDYNTANGKYVGIAPGAELIIVKSDMGQIQFSDALEWIACQANDLGKPFVINYSAGNLNGPRDGNSPIEKTTYEIINGSDFDDGCVVKSAGNSQTRQFHARKSYEDTGVLIYGDDFDDEAFEIYVYYESHEDLLVSVTPPNSNARFLEDDGVPNDDDLVRENYYAKNMGDGWYEKDGEQLAVGWPSESGTVAINNEYWKDEDGDPNMSPIYPDTDKNHIVITLYPAFVNGYYFPVERGMWTVNVNSTGGTYDLDVVIDYEHYNSTGRIKVREADQSLTHNITEPGNVENIITVGSIVSKREWKDGSGSTMTGPNTAPLGNISYFSSRGPTRSYPELEKPEIYAPGQWVLAPKSNLVAYNSDYSQYDITNYEYAAGTSMSAPVVTGAIALMFSSWRKFDPNFNRDDVITRIKQWGVPIGGEPNSKYLNIWDSTCKDRPLNNECDECGVNIDMTEPVNK